MNDQRASRPSNALRRETPRGVRRRLGNRRWDRRHAVRWLSSSPAKGRRLNPGRRPGDLRQSRLNTTDASQPVMTAIMALTTP